MNINQYIHTRVTENTASVAKAANGLCIFNQIVQPDGSGNDPPGVQEIEIDFCRHTGRQAQHLPSVGDCKQTPASSHEEGPAAVMTQPWILVEGMRSEVIVRMQFGRTAVCLVSWCKVKNTAIGRD